LPGHRGPLRNRSKLEITADILRLLAKGPTPKTYVMYGANLSYEMLNPYLELLLNAGLIEKREAPPDMKNDIRSGGRYNFLYSLTSKGMDALKQLESLEESMGLLGLKIQKHQEVFA
jgi:predicted transcriptional regulator